MKIKELLEILQKFNPETSVGIFACGNGWQEIQDIDSTQYVDLIDEEHGCIMIVGDDY